MRKLLDKVGIDRPIRPAERRLEKVTSRRDPVLLQNLDQMVECLPVACVAVPEYVIVPRQVAGLMSVTLPARLVRIPSRSIVSTDVLRARARSSATPNLPVA